MASSLFPAAPNSVGGAYGGNIPYSSGYAGYGQLGQGGLGGQVIPKAPLSPFRNTFGTTPAMPYSQAPPGAQSTGAFSQQPATDPAAGNAVSGFSGALNGLKTNGGANVGGIVSAVGQGINDFGEINRLANINTNNLVDKSFEGSSPFDNVGTFNTQKNPFDTSAGAVLGTVGSKAATGAAIGTSILPGWGTAIGAVAGGLVGGVESIFGGSKHRQFEQSQSRAMARYQAIKNQQLAYRQKQQQQQAQTNYTAQRMNSLYNF